APPPPGAPQPTTSPCSVGPRSRSFTCLPQPGLDRVAVDAAVLEVELVRPVGDGVDRVAGREPERNRLAAPAVLLARPRLGELRVRCVDRAAVLERLPLAILAEDLPDHPAKPRATRRAPTAPAR